jgi:hypothetical protein
MSSREALWTLLTHEDEAHRLQGIELLHARPELAEAMALRIRERPRRAPNFTPPFDVVCALAELTFVELQFGVYNGPLDRVGPGVQQLHGLSSLSLSGEGTLKVVGLEDLETLSAFEALVTGGPGPRLKTATCQVPPHELGLWSALPTLSLHLTEAPTMAQLSTLTGHRLFLSLTTPEPVDVPVFDAMSLVLNGFAPTATTHGSGGGVAFNHCLLPESLTLEAQAVRLYKNRGTKELLLGPETRRVHVQANPDLEHVRIEGARDLLDFQCDAPATFVDCKRP